MNRQIVSPAELRQRIKQLDELRLQRSLSDAEKAEADQLSMRLYMREWRAQERERELALNLRLRNSPCPTSTSETSA